MVLHPGQTCGDLLAPLEHLCQLLQVAHPQGNAVLNLGGGQVDGPLHAGEQMPQLRAGSHTRMLWKS